MISAFRIQIQVLNALFMRELVVRYGRDNLGFLWLVVEPLILTTGVMILWTYLRHAEHGISLIGFVLTGYMPLTLWRHISSYMVSCLRQNMPLLYYRPVRVLDLLIVRGFMEFCGSTLALVVVYVALRLFDVIEPFDDIGLLLAGWLYMAWLAFGVGLILAALSERYEFIEKLVPPFQYLLLPVSGVFFMVAWLPSSVQDIAFWVPLIHCYEMFRAGMFGSAVDTHFSIPYITSVCLVVTLIGLMMVKQTSQHMAFE